MAQCQYPCTECFYRHFPNYLREASFPIIGKCFKVTPYLLMV